MNTDSIKNNELYNILVTRQWFYDFLAKSYYQEPNLNHLKNIESSNILSTIEGFREKDKNTGIGILSEIFQGSASEDREYLKNLVSEYNRLFVGPDQLYAPPWESVYRGREKILFDEHTLEVRNFYNKWGVQTTSVNKEPDDHIGYELEFVSILINKSITALNDNNEEYLKDTIVAQRSFLQTHLLTWVEEFVDRVLENTTEEYFKGIGLLTLEFLDMDIQLVEELIDSLDQLI